MTGPVLLLEALSWRFPNAPGPLFEGLSAPIPAGLTLVCGDEGCGKSTLLRLMAGQLAPQGGRILAGTPAAPWSRPPCARKSSGTTSMRPASIKTSSLNCLGTG